jgi:nicotinate-nucleotide adenylyltransferase
MAQALVRQFGVQRLWVVPTGNAWHKASHLSPAEHRLAMAKLAFADVPEAVVDERELHRQGPSYTIDTLTELQAEQPAAHWLLLMGQDQWDRFTTWHRWQDVAQIATIVVAARAYSESAIANFSSQTSPPVPPLARPEGAPARLDCRALDWQAMAMSSTAVRQSGEGATTMVPLAVARYISQHHLYPNHS